MYGTRKFYGPITPTSAGLIEAGASTASGFFDTIYNGIQNSNTNRRNENFAVQMYDKQRADALTDRDFSNNYNSPAAQMERLKAAGLNPNLAAGGGAFAPQPAASPRPSSVPSFKAEPAHADTSGIAGGLAHGLEAMYNLANKQADTNNLQANHDVIVQENLLKKAQTGVATEQENTERYSQSRIDASRRLDEQSLRTNSQLSDIQVAKARLDNQKTIADTQFTLSQNERAEALKSMSLQEAAARILNMRVQNAKTDAERQRTLQEIENLKTDNHLKSLDEELKQNGIQPHDNLFMRTLGTFLNQVAPSSIQPEPTHLSY